MAHTASDTLSNTQQELEKLVSDLRGLISSRDLDSVPEIRALRQRLDDGMQVVRDSTVRCTFPRSAKYRACVLADPSTSSPVW